MQVLIVMPSYCAFVNLKDGNNELNVLPIPTDFTLVDKSLIKQAVKEILMYLGIE